jgi:chorismate synthase
VKQTPSIALFQSTVDLARGEEAEIRIKNGHDPAIPPRIVSVAEAMVALVPAAHRAAEEGGASQTLGWDFAGRKNASGKM